MINFIREERKRQHISLKELSNKSGVSWRTISNWEYNGIMPTIDNFQKVLNALGYDLIIAPQNKLSEGE